MKERLVRWILHPQWRYWAMFIAALLIPVAGWLPLELLWLAQAYVTHQQTDARSVKLFCRVMMVLVGGLLLHNVINLLTLFGEIL